jgi:uncharacterized membrane protein
MMMPVTMPPMMMVMVVMMMMVVMVMMLVLRSSVSNASRENDRQGGSAESGNDGLHGSLPH